MRFIYNTTFHIENEIEEDFKRAIRKIYIPCVEEGELCSDIFFTRVWVDAEEGQTFSLLLVFDYPEHYGTFARLYKKKLLMELTNLFGQKVLHFSTTMEEF